MLYIQGKSKSPKYITVSKRVFDISTEKHLDCEAIKCEPDTIHIFQKSLPTQILSGLLVLLYELILFLCYSIQIPTCNHNQRLNEASELGQLRISYFKNHTLHK
jgi:hypothetical protein